MTVEIYAGRWETLDIMGVDWHDCRDDPPAPRHRRPTHRLFALGGGPRDPKAAAAVLAWLRLGDSATLAVK